MSQMRFTQVMTLGLAMFAMFFGAGNVIFPLLVGKEAGSSTLAAFAGLFVTAVLVPFAGLISAMLFGGDYRQFFSRIGRIPGLLLAGLILLLIGPCAGIPRTIALSHTTLSLSLPGMPIWAFGIVACGLVFLGAYRRQRVVTILGRFLTPALLLCLAILIVVGLCKMGDVAEESLGQAKAFWRGLAEGYNMLDLLAAFFFASVAVGSVAKRPDGELRLGQLLPSACIGATFLGAVYLGLSLLAAHSQAALAGRHPEEFLGVLGLHVFGLAGQAIMGCLVALACLTTAIALASICASALSQDLLKGRISYERALIAILIVGYLLSWLGFSQIVKLISPIVVLAYPALLMLALVNLAHKLRAFQPVRAPVYAVLGLTALYQCATLIL